MAVDYDAPRQAAEEEPMNLSTSSRRRRRMFRGPGIDVDETDLAESFELPGADLSKEELLVQVVPVQSDEFTCMSCFLVHHRNQLVREQDGKMYCAECES